VSTVAFARAPDPRPERVPAAPVADSAPLSFGLLLVFLLLVFANIALLVPALEPIAPAQVVAVSALVLVFLERTRSRRPFRLAWPESHLLIALVAVGLLSSFTALWPRYALDNAALLAKCLAVYLLILNTVESWRRMRRLLWVIVLGFLIPAVGTLHHRVTGQLVEGGRAAWIGIFDNPNDLAFTLAMAIPLAAALASVERGWRRLVLCGAVGLYSLALFLTFSRGGLIGFAVVAGLCMLRWSSPWVRLPAALIFGALLIYVVPEFWQRRQGLADLRDDPTVRERLATFEAGYNMFTDRPLLGVGPGCSEIGFPKYAPREYAQHGWLHSHNTIVQAFGETGFLGGAAFVLALAFGLAKSRRLARGWRARGRPEVHPVVSSFEISLWGFLACGMAGGYLLSWFPYIWLGLISAAGVLSEAAVPVAVTPKRRWTTGEAPCAASPAF
jgi:putative inorganic carbon (HCO3(-)) transporter